MYASTCGLERKKFWAQIHSVLSLNQLLLLMEDFNYILNANDKKRGKTFYIDRDIKEFQNFFQSAGLVDLHFQGPRYT